jgi:hypothetical protein
MSFIALFLDTSAEIWTSHFAQSRTAAHAALNETRGDMQGNDRDTPMFDGSSAHTLREKPLARIRQSCRKTGSRRH